MNQNAAMISQENSITNNDKEAHGFQAEASSLDISENIKPSLVEIDRNRTSKNLGRNILINSD